MWMSLTTRLRVHFIYFKQTTHKNVKSFTKISRITSRFNVINHVNGAGTMTEASKCRIAHGMMKRTMNLEGSGRDIY